MLPTAHQPRSAYTWMTVGCVLFSTMNVAARLASRGVPWPVVACSRAFVGALVAYAIARARGVRLDSLGTRSMWARSIFGTLAMASTFYALGASALPLGDACTLFALTPVFIAVFAPIFLRERTGRGVWFAVVLSTIGVVLVVRPSFLFGAAAASREALVPALVALFAAVVSSFAMMMLRKIGRLEVPQPPEAVVFHFSATATVSLSFFAVPSLLRSGIGSWKSLVSMVIAGLAAGVAQLAMTRAYALETAVKIGAFANLTIVLSTLGGVALLSESVSATSIVGMLLVIAGSLFISLERALSSRYRERT